VKEVWIAQVEGSAQLVLGDKIQTVPMVHMSRKPPMLSFSSPAAHSTLTSPSF
jgi:hypothetical protein